MLGGYHLNSSYGNIGLAKNVVQVFLQDVINATDVMCIIYIYENMYICKIHIYKMMYICKHICIYICVYKFIQMNTLDYL